jgi:hypothetical protein
MFIAIKFSYGRPKMFAVSRKTYIAFVTEVLLLLDTVLILVWGTM